MKPPNRIDWRAARTWDGALLCLLIVAMCSQIDPLTLGRDTFVTQGFVTKQLKVAVSDLALVLVFGWFVIRTTMLRAWSKLWWPPLPCWALLAALLVAALHSTTIVNALAAGLESGGIKGAIKAIAAKEPKEAIAEIAQYAAYFIAAPLLFVNLMLDRREDVLIVRRSLALRAFAVATGLVILIGLAQLFKGSDAPRGTWQSANLYGGFLAMALPLLFVGVAHRWNQSRGTVGVGAEILAAWPTMVTPWGVIGLFIGMLLGAVALRSVRAAGIALVLSLVALLSWNTFKPLQPARAEYFHIKTASEKERGKMEVKKQYVEWYAAQGFSAPGEARFGTGVGPGNYQLNIGSYYAFLPNAKKMPPDSNNLYLVQAVSVGTLGLGALLWIIGHFMGVAWRARRAFGADWLSAGVLGSLSAWLLVNCFHALVVRGLGIVLAFVLSLAIVALQAARDAENRNEAAPQKS